MLDERFVAAIESGIFFPGFFKRVEKKKKKTN